MTIIGITDALEKKSWECQATVKGKGQVKSGNKPDGTTWSMCKIDVQDGSGSAVITLWNDEINKVEVGIAYVFKGYTKEYNNEKTLALGKFGSIAGSPSSQSSQQKPAARSIPAKSELPKSFEPKHLDGSDVVVWHSILDKLMEYDMLADIRFAGNSDFDSTNPAHTGQIKNWAFATFQEFKKLQVMQQSKNQEKQE